MAYRAMWRGVITSAKDAGALSVPVKLYSAIESRGEGISFNLLHAPDLVPLRQVLVNERTRQPVPKEHIARGWEQRKGRYVVIDEQQLEELEPEPSRDIELLRFVERSELDPRLFLRGYYLGPDSSSREYAALAAALEASSRVGICRWTMRKQRYVGALALTGETLALTTLRQPQELVEIGELGAQKFSERELKTARFLVQELAGEWDPAAYQDTYQLKLAKLLEQKAKGVKIPKPKTARTAATKSGELLELLEASVKDVKSRQSRRKRGA